MVSFFSKWKVIFAIVWSITVQLIQKFDIWSLKHGDRKQSYNRTIFNAKQNTKHFSWAFFWVHFQEFTVQFHRNKIDHTIDSELTIMFVLKYFLLNVAIQSMCQQINELTHSHKSCNAINELINRVCILQLKIRLHSYSICILYFLFEHLKINSIELRCIILALKQWLMREFLTLAFVHIHRQHT